MDRLEARAYGNGRRRAGGTQALQLVTVHLERQTRMLGDSVHVLVAAT
jgi:hypothetical protein